MSSSTTSATRRSRSDCDACFTAAAAAFSQDVVLVPMSSTTVYTLSAMPASVLPFAPTLGTAGAAVSARRSRGGLAEGLPDVGRRCGLVDEGGFGPAPERDLVGHRPVASLAVGPGHRFLAGPHPAHAAFGLVGEAGGLVHGIADHRVLVAL